MGPILSSYDRQFTSLDRLSRELIGRIGDGELFVKPRTPKNSMAMFSSGEYLLRSAAMVEQTFGGITTRLWDDPFEWTLPEKLATSTEILGYLDEVEATRQQGFGLFTSDQDLSRELPAPVKMLTVAELLIATLRRSSHFQGRAFAVFQMLTDEKLPRL